MRPVIEIVSTAGDGSLVLAVGKQRGPVVLVAARRVWFRRIVSMLSRLAVVVVRRLVRLVPVMVLVVRRLVLVRIVGRALVLRRVRLGVLLCRRDRSVVVVPDLRVQRDM